MDGTWVLFRSAGYLTGRGVTYGNPLIPSQAINPNVYSIPIGQMKIGGIAAVDEHLSIIKDASLDHVLVTPTIAAHGNPGALLTEAWKALKTGGHLVLFLLCGVEEPGTKTFYPDEIKESLASLGRWQLKAEYTQDKQWLLILKKLDGRRGLLPAKPRATKRVCIARYGALGDAIIMTPLIKALAEDGYEVTLNVSGYCWPVLANNPHVHNVIMQERDMIPNHLLGKYWALWASEYDKYINLSESIEGDLLMIEGRAPFFTTKAWRHSVCNRNYYDFTMARGGYPDKLGSIGELYFTSKEERVAKAFFASLGRTFNVVWALNGSSHHKLFPLLGPMLQEWFKAHSDVRVITVGDYPAKLMEFEHPQLIPRAGVWSIREALIATKFADLVCGPETMITNAAGCFPTPKIVLLSHSSRENLTKYFQNDHSLEPDQSTAPCYPCHQLHYTRESCPIGEMKDTNTGTVIGSAPICAIGINPGRVIAEMDSVYAAWKGTSNATANHTIVVSHGTEPWTEFPSRPLEEGITHGHVDRPSGV